MTILGVDISNIIFNLFFTKMRRRVLTFVGTHPFRSFYADEVIGLAGSGSGVVESELARLGVAGLITSHFNGNEKRYQTNVSWPLFSVLRNSCVKNFAITDVLLKALDLFSANIELAFVYGSVARKNENANSDISFLMTYLLRVEYGLGPRTNKHADSTIDLMVICDISTHTSLLAALKLASIELGREINPSLYTRNGLPPTSRTHSLGA